MKYFNNILFLLLISLTSCVSQQENNQKHPRHQKGSDTVIRQNFDKKIMPENKKETNEKTVTQKDLDKLASQKTQQYFDMLNLLKQKKSQSDFKNYIEKYARKLWINPKKAMLFSQQFPIKTADSLKVKKMALVNVKENNAQELIGNYRLTYIFYKNKMPKTHQTKAEILFSIIDLSLNGKIYQTVKTRILSIE